MASVVDSLAAVEQLVFRDKEMSLKELAGSAGGNYAGQRLSAGQASKRMPKFGNDIDWVDGLGRRVVDIFCDEVATGQPGRSYLYTFFPCISTDRDFTTMGKDVGATPDGRRAGEQVSENQSPTQGADMNGLTALLNSVAGSPYRESPVARSISASTLGGKGENGLPCSPPPCKTYLRAGRDAGAAQRDEPGTAPGRPAEPHKYKNLCVRVTGYSAYFVQMGKKPRMS